MSKNATFPVKVGVRVRINPEIKHYGDYKESMRKNTFTIIALCGLPEGTMSSDYAERTSYIRCKDSCGNVSDIYIRDLAAVSVTPEELLAELQDEISAEETRYSAESDKLKSSHDSKMADLNGRVSYVKETNVTYIDENELKAWVALTTLENPNLSKMERAKILAGLISKK